MKVVALVSGGKDSCYNMYLCTKEGHEIVALANLHPPEGKDELDSYMYQTVGHQAISLYSEAAGIPLFRREIKGKPLNTGESYTGDLESDEVEDLYHLLVDIKSAGVQFEAISVGAILSNYQRVRAQNVCDRLGLTMLAYLWERNQKDLLSDMIKDGIEAILIKVAAMGLSAEDLGKSLSEVFPKLVKLNEQYGINVCGEGGEYETLTLNCPLFSRKLCILEQELVTHSNDAFAPVAYLKPLKVSLMNK